MGQETRSVRIIEADAEVLKMLAAAEGITIAELIHRQRVHFEQCPPKKGLKQITVAILARLRRGS